LFVCFIIATIVSAKMQGTPITSWNKVTRTIVFCLAATSIACLMVEFYKLCPMREFTLWIFFPACAALIAIAAISFLKGDRQLARIVTIGIIAGLIAAVSYDIFRLPFVYAKEWGIANIVPPMNLYKVFPRFGAMILNQPLEQETYTTSAQLVGWLYHFSNGATFGVMYVAMVGDATKRSWLWAVLMAAGIEAAMLLTPYPAFFGIPLTAMFIIVTLTAHLIFGAAMGLTSRVMMKTSGKRGVQPA
jgi:hypothetical protein